MFKNLFRMCNHDWVLKAKFVTPTQLMANVYVCDKCGEESMGRIYTERKQSYDDTKTSA